MSLKLHGSQKCILHTGDGPRGAGACGVLEETEGDTPLSAEENTKEKLIKRPRKNMTKAVGHWPFRSEAEVLLIWWRCGDTTADRS